jgi:hypothetical protein
MILLLLACTVDDTVQIAVSGRLFDGPEADALVVAGATVAALDANGEEVDRATSSSLGEFSVQVPGWDTFHLHLGAEGFATTAFSGNAGGVDVTADDGVLWLRSEDELAALRATHAACPSAQDEGGVVEGLMRLYIPDQEDPDTLPVVTTGHVSAWTADGVEYPACYLDDEGASSADADETGETGRFAVFGVPSGPISVSLSYAQYGVETDPGWYFVWMGEDQVAPLYPALVEGL